MKNKKRITTRIIIVIILVISILFLVQPRRRFNNMVIKNEKTLAIMVEKSEGKYIEYRGKKWPKIGYRFNPDKTSCVDRDKNDIGNLIEYDARQNIAIMKSNRSAFCTLYFDIDTKAPEGSFYIGKEESQEYTNNKNEEIHIKIEDDDAIEYCLTNTKDSVTCIENWKDIPTLEDGWFKTTDYDLGSDGEETVYLYLKDGAKNISEVKEDRIVLDRVMPECVVTGGSTNWTKENRTITWGCSDDRSGCTVSNVGNHTYTETTKTAIITNYEIEDRAGNKKECNGERADVYVDKDKPTCTLQATSSGVSFASTDGTTSNISNSGINTSTTPSYSNSTQSLSVATFYGHVKDEADNTGICSIQVVAKDVSKQTQTIYTCGYNLSSYDCVFNEPACGILNPSYPRIAWRHTTGNNKCWYATEWTGSYCKSIYPNCNEYWCSGNHSGNSSYCYYYRNTRCPSGSTVVHTQEYNSKTGKYMDGYGLCMLYNQPSCGSEWSINNYNYSYFYSLTSSEEVDSCTATSPVTCSSTTSGSTYTTCEGSSTRTCPSGTTSINDNYCYK